MVQIFPRSMRRIIEEHVVNLVIAMVLGLWNTTVQIISTLPNASVVQNKHITDEWGTRGRKPCGRALCPTTKRIYPAPTCEGGAYPVLYNERYPSPEITIEPLVQWKALKSPGYTVLGIYYMNLNPWVMRSIGEVLNFIKIEFTTCVKFRS